MMVPEIKSAFEGLYPKETKLSDKELTDVINIIVQQVNHPDIDKTMDLLDPFKGKLSESVYTFIMGLVTTAETTMLKKFYSWMVYKDGELVAIFSKYDDTIKYMRDTTEVGVIWKVVRDNIFIDNYFTKNT